MKHPTGQTLASLVLVATALFGLACNETRTPTEPVAVVNPPAPTPAPAWTGTYNGVSPICDSSAQASLEQTGATIKGTMTVPCLNAQYRFQFSGDLQGNTLTGFAIWGDPEFYPLKGTLSASSLEITIFNETGGTPMGQLHLHR